MARARGLTERIIRGAKPGPKTVILWDDRVRGLGVRITRAGAKSFILNYRVAGKERRATLAPVGGVNLREARERAGAELANIKGGGADPLSRREEAAAAPTVAEGVARFFDEFAPERVRIGRMSPRTVAEYRHQSRAYVLPALGERKVEQVTRRHVELMVANAAPALRNRVLAFTSRLFAQFERWEWKDQGGNPAKGIERAREEPRDRVLSSTEMAALATGLDDLEQRHPAAVAAVRTAALSGLRIGEVLNMCWGDIDVESGRPHPADHENGAAHTRSIGTRASGAGRRATGQRVVFQRHRERGDPIQVRTPRLRRCGEGGRA